MTKLQVFLDLTMCVAWMLTYILVLISTKIYKYPAICPYTQATMLPVEIGIFTARIILGTRFNFIIFFYFFCVFIEFAIIVEIIRLKFLKNLKLYFASIAILSGGVTYLVIVQNYMLFCAYFLTFSGAIIWLVFILTKKDYPFNILNLMVFFTKFIADVVLIPVYLDIGPISIITDILVFALPSVDLLSIIVFLMKKRLQNNQHDRKEIAESFRNS